MAVWSAERVVVEPSVEQTDSADAQKTLTESEAVSTQEVLDQNVPWQGGLRCGGRQSMCSTCGRAQHGTETEHCMRAYTTTYPRA
jgi:hypothetical protein